MGKIVCPRCKSTRIQPNRSRGLRDQIIKLYGKRAYRCVSCGWRGTMERPRGAGSRYPGKMYSLSRILIFIVIVLIAITALVYWFSREP